jgi:hypothetical protein
MQHDHTRTPVAKARTLSRRMERRARIARNGAALLGLLAFAPDVPAFTAFAPVKG